MTLFQLAQVHFSPATTAEEKIIFAFTRVFSIRKIKEAFQVGTDKINATIKYYKRTGEVPPPQKKSSRKLSPEILASIHNMIYADAHVTLETMRKTRIDK